MQERRCKIVKGAANINNAMHQCFYITGATVSEGSSSQLLGLNWFPLGTDTGTVSSILRNADFG